MPENTGKSIIGFVHIEKACGTTLHHIFRSNWPLAYAHLAPRRGWTHSHGGIWRTEEAHSFLCRFPYIKGIGGHSFAPYLDYNKATGRSFKLITYLREPISRYVSHYKYQRDVMALNRTFEAFVQSKDNDNCMVRRIAGEDNVSKAIDILEEKQITVGLLEDFDRSLLLIKRSCIEFDIQFNYKIRNQAIKKEESESFEKLNGVIEEKNQLDVALYQYVREHIYPKQLQAYEGDIEADLKVFRSENEHYKLSGIKRYFSAALKKAVYEPSQRNMSKLAEKADD